MWRRELSLCVVGCGGRLRVCLPDELHDCGWTGRVSTEMNPKGCGATAIVAEKLIGRDVKLRLFSKLKN